VHSVVVGLGEVGGALYNILKDHYRVVGIDLDRGVGHACADDGTIYAGQCEYLNICIPYSEKFVDVVNDYIKQFKPLLTINHSSVPVGTTKKLIGTVVHSPVRGRHPKIDEGLKLYKKFVGYNDATGYVEGIRYFDGVFDTEFVANSDTTEFLKIISLAKYLVYLAMADEVNECCKAFGVDYELVKKWDRSQNEFINKFYPDLKLPILDPPGGVCGGHCVMPVTEMMIDDKRFSAPLVVEARSRYKSL
jgi:UDP-N-acetyl-D-mannosaminuronate dehydrogenase